MKRKNPSHAKREPQVVKKKKPTVLYVSPARSEEKKTKKTKKKPNTMFIEIIDMKQKRRDILENWRAFMPKQIVEWHKQHYSNLRSAAVMLSRLKGELGALEDPPPDDKFLSKLALSKKEYNEIRVQNSDARKRGAMDVVTINNGDAIVLQALRYITDSDPNLLIAALFPLTGMRPIKIAKMARFQTTLNNKQEHQAWWACQTRFAKRGTMTTKYNECWDRPFLVPYWLVERALVIIRKRWPTKGGLTNREISRKYSSHWQKILQKAYQQVPGINARLCRRFFAVYSFHYFGKSVFIGGASQSSLNGYASIVGSRPRDPRRPGDRLLVFDHSSNAQAKAV